MGCALCFNFTFIRLQLLQIYAFIVLHFARTSHVIKALPESFCLSR